MKALIAAAVVVTAVPMVAASGQDGATTAKQERQERRTCRWVEARAASRMKLRRVCMTPLQWRVVNDSSVDDEMAEIGVRSQRMAMPENGVNKAVAPH